MLFYYWFYLQVFANFCNDCRFFWKAKYKRRLVFKHLDPQNRRKMQQRGARSFTTLISAVWLRWYLESHQTCLSRQWKLLVPVLTECFRQAQGCRKRGEVVRLERNKTIFLTNVQCDHNVEITSIASLSTTFLKNTAQIFDREGYAEIQREIITQNQPAGCYCAARPFLIWRLKKEDKLRLVQQNQWLDSVMYVVGTSHCLSNYRRQGREKSVNELKHIADTGFNLLHVIFLSQQHSVKCIMSHFAIKQRRLSFYCICWVGVSTLRKHSLKTQLCKELQV